MICRRCVMPGTRPDLHMGADGVCDACRSTEAKARVDWAVRGREWEALAAWARAEAALRDLPYDAIAAVSGGKDSHWIVIKALAAGLRVLGVSFEPTSMTPLGQANLENLQALGCDVVQVKKNRKVYRQLGWIGLRDVGDHEWPNHVGIFTSVIREAVLRRIPLVLWGESPQIEYGGPAASKANRVLDRRWLDEFGGMLGLRVADLIEDYGMSWRDLALYTWPSEAMIAAAGEIRSEFLGGYFAWDTVAQSAEVQKAGFRCAPGRIFNSLWEYENVDCRFVIWHDYLGWLKYGYSRAQAQASIAIRHGHWTRGEAEAWLRDHPTQFPGHQIHDFADYFGVRPSAIVAVCDQYTNRKLFEVDVRGDLIKDKGEAALGDVRIYGTPRLRREGQP